jgi:hypothetical protein
MHFVTCCVSVFALKCVTLCTETHLSCGNLFLCVELFSFDSLFHVGFLLALLFSFGLILIVFDLC